MMHAANAISSSEAEFPAEFAGFWASLRSGKLSFPRCLACSKFHWYPMKHCPHCLSTRIAWEPISGSGTLYSWTVVRRAFSADFEEAVPYVVGLIDFPEASGVRLITDVVEADPSKLRIGMAMVPVFRDANERMPLVFFRPADIAA
jgi:uncharacterized OB-fold protein